MEDSNKEVQKKTLVFSSHRTNRTIYENFEKGLSKSKFFDEYKAALKICNEIIVNLKGTHKENRSSNIISFIGNRGVGKTSFMMNFVTLLCRNNEKTFKEMDNLNIDWLKEDSANHIYFKSIRLVDPTLLEDKESLFEYVVGEMFQELKIYIDEAGNKSGMGTFEIDNDALFKKLVQKFKDMQDTLIKIKKTRRGDIDENENTIEAMLAISASASLEKCFEALVTSYLDFCAEHPGMDYLIWERKKKLSERKKFLLIPIDDMDLLTHNVLEYTEEIRKFMKIPNVIVLLNYDLDRYSQIILNVYLEFNKKLHLYSNNSDYEDLRKRVREQLSVVSNYMEKVFPMDQRVILPSISSLLNSCTFEFYHSENREDYENRIENNSQPEVRANSLTQFFLSPVYWLTQMRFPASDGSNAYVPHNLRELHNFLKDMYQECTYYNYNKGNKIEKELRIIDERDKILDWMAHDIIFRWGKENLTRLQYLFLDEMWDLPHKEKLNFTYQFFSKRENSLNSESKFARRSTDKDNKSKCRNLEEYINVTHKKQISFGDLFYACKYFSERDLVGEGRWERFGFAVLALFSILLKKEEFNNRNNPDDKNVFKDFMPDDIGFFGFSSLRLMNILEKSNDVYSKRGYSLIPDSAQVTVPIGRIEYKDEISIPFPSSFKHINGKCTDIDKFAEDYSALENLLIFFDVYCSNTDSLKAGCSNAVCLDIINNVIIFNKGITFDILNPLKKLYYHNDSCNQFRKNIINKLFSNCDDDEKKIIEEKIKKIQNDLFAKFSQVKIKMEGKSENASESKSESKVENTPNSKSENMSENKAKNTSESKSALPPLLSDLVFLAAIIKNVEEQYSASYVYLPEEVSSNPDLNPNNAAETEPAANGAKEDNIRAHIKAVYKSISQAIKNEIAILFGDSQSADAKKVVSLAGNDYLTEYIEKLYNIVEKVLDNNLYDKKFDELISQLVRGKTKYNHLLSFDVHKYKDNKN